MLLPYVPAAQLAQEDAPLPLYFPAPQFAQVPMEVAPVAALAVPGGQAVQVDAPFPENFPAAQLEQDPAPLLL